MKGYSKSKLYILPIILFSLVFIISCQISIGDYVPGSNSLLELHTIDVGQGDSILLKLPNGEAILIDGGSRNMGDRVVGYIKGLGINKIDHLIATHPHEDHIGGLIKVIENVEIGKIYMPDVQHTSKTFLELLETIEKNNYKIKRAKSGVAITENQSLKAYFIGPIKEKYSGLNNYSAVVKVDYGDISIILAGDAEAEAEEDMIKTHRNLRADILKVGHHGSSTSTTDQFLDKVNPKYGVISLGKNNSYGHPHRETLDKLNQRKINILRTDIQGNIIIKTDGKEIYQK